MHLGIHFAKKLSLDFFFSFFQNFPFLKETVSSWGISQIFESFKCRINKADTSNSFLPSGYVVFKEDLAFCCFVFWVSNHKRFTSIVHSCHREGDNSLVLSPVRVK